MIIRDSTSSIITIGRNIIINSFWTISYRSSSIIFIKSNFISCKWSCFSYFCHNCIKSYSNIWWICTWIRIILKSNPCRWRCNWITPISYCCLHINRSFQSASIINSTIRSRKNIIIRNCFPYIRFSTCLRNI